MFVHTNGTYVHGRSFIAQQLCCLSSPFLSRGKRQNGVTNVKAAFVCLRVCVWYVYIYMCVYMCVFAVCVYVCMCLFMHACTYVVSIYVVYVRAYVWQRLRGQHDWMKAYNPPLVM